jgi:hypothetical protein
VISCDSPQGRVLPVILVWCRRPGWAAISPEEFCDEHCGCILFDHRPVGLGDPRLAGQPHPAGGRHAYLRCHRPGRVPSGAATGSREAVELRDGDAARYGGKGVTHARRQRQRRIARPARRPDLDLTRAGRRGDDRGRRHRKQVAPRGERHRRGVNGSRAGAGHWRTVVRVPGAGWSRAASARAALQRAQRRGPCAQLAGLPGVHGRPDRGAVDARGRAGRGRGLREAARTAPKGRVRYRTGTRAASPRTSPDRKTCSPCWCRRSKTRGTPRAATG